MSITYHEDIHQGSVDWINLRAGLLTASEMKHLLTGTFKPSANDKSRALFWKLLAQRITGYVEPEYWSDDMLRGAEDEIESNIIYSKTYAPIKPMGFITNNKWGFTLGYSPDGLVGDDGLVEDKSRRQDLQVRTIVELVPDDQIDSDFVIQCQSGLLISERKWIDLNSYSGGLPMSTVRVYPDLKIQEAILDAATDFESKLKEARAKYDAVLSSNARLIPTVRKIVQEIY